MHPSWTEHLATELEEPYFKTLLEQVKDERIKHRVLPPRGQVFAAFDATPFEDVRVVILGQDPYPTPGHAHGLCFSVLPDVQPLPKSLGNIFKELAEDLKCPRPKVGYLMPWAERGVLLLNSILTVRAGETGSHCDLGWETFTDQVIATLSDQNTERIVFILWGAFARGKKQLIDQKKHYVIESAHPSPLSAHNGFFGSRPFSHANRALEDVGRAPIDWRL